MKPRKNKVNATGRNTGDGKFLNIPRYIFDSPAYRDMRPVERCALHELMYRYNGKNNGYIPFSIREMGQRLGCCKDTAIVALQSVVNHGFAFPKSEGVFTLKERHSTEWLLPMFGYPTDKDQPTKDFMRWQPKPKKARKPYTRRAPKSEGNVINLADVGVRK